MLGLIPLGNSSFLLGMMIKRSSFILLLLAFTLLAPGASAQDLEKIEATLAAKPYDPMLHYRKCQALFTSGKEQEAVTHASVALEKFKASGKSLAWMRLGSFPVENFRIDVHFNMGPRERAAKKDGIVRPYSFRVWKTQPELELVRMLDFELAYFEGLLISAAIGENTADAHLNLGIVDPKSDFATIKSKVVEILSK